MSKAKNKAIVVSLTVYLHKGEWQALMQFKRRTRYTWREILLAGKNYLNERRQNVQDYKRTDNYNAQD
ncbi:MAG: hypothetical protein QW734_08555 [Candidatus Bathyarchaeia archaeon]